MSREVDIDLDNELAGPNEWRPHKRQADFLSIPFSIFEALFGGAAGPGKSEVLIMLPIVSGLFQLRKFKGLLLRRTFPELEKSLILRTQEVYPSTGGIYNKQLRRWHWPAYGSILDFGYAEHEQDVRKYDTTEYTYIGFDELTSFTEFQYRYLSFTRCRTSDPSVPAFVRGATNPGNIGHGWVRERFVAPAREGYKRIVDSLGNSRIFIPALPTDNPYLIKADPQYIKRLEALPEAEKRAKLYGDWWTFEGQAFEFRTERFPGEPENALHVIDPFPIPHYWPKILSIDWGWSAMTYALWAAISPDKRLYCYKEYACNGQISDKLNQPKKKLSEWAEDIVNLSVGENIISINVDPSARQNRGEPLTIFEQLYKKISGRVGINRVRLELADNDRRGGKLLIQELLRWKEKPASIPQGQFDQAYANWLLANRSKEVYDSYVSAFVPKPLELNLPQVQIFKTCPILINTIPLCVLDEDDPEDVAEFDGDDPYDVFRYMCKQFEKHVLTGSKAYAEYMAQNKILDEFNRTQDYNQLAWRMAQAGNKKRESNKLFHKVRVLPISDRPVGI